MKDVRAIALVAILSITTILAVNAQYQHLYATGVQLAFDNHSFVEPVKPALVETRSFTTTTQRTYVFGINLALNASEAGSFAWAQQESLVGFTVWVDWWNALPASLRTTRWGEVVDVQLHVETWSDYGLGFTPEAQTILFDVYANMTQNKSIDYYFGTAAFLGVALRQYMYESLGVEIMVHHLDSGELFYAVPGSFGAPTANVLVMTSWLPYLRLNEAKTLVTIEVYDYIYQNELCQGVRTQAPLNGLEVVASYDMPFDWYTEGAIIGVDNRSEIWTQMLDEVRALNPDAIAICDYGYGAEFALNYMREHDWTPKSVMISPSYSSFVDPTLTDYTIQPAIYNPNANYPAQANFTNSAGYNALVQQRYNRSASSVAAQATLSGMMYTNALINSPSNATADIITTMRTQPLTSFMGVEQNDVYNHQTLIALVTQWLNNGTQINVVGPAQAAVNNFIYPMPTWSERVFDPKWGSREEIAGLVLICVGCAINLVWLVFIVVNWRHRKIVEASPVFCLLIILGGMIMNIAIFTWMPNLVNTPICMLRAWLLPIGFMLMFGALLAKTYRIERIFNANILINLKISNFDVALVVFFIVFIQIALSILLITVGQLQAVVHQVDPYRVSLNYFVCLFPVANKAVFGLNLVYAVGLLGWGTFLAFRVRKIKNSNYDESKEIIFSTYNVALMAAIVTVVQMAIGNSSRDLTFMITAVCAFLGSTITTCCLFIPKAYNMIRTEQKSQSQSNSTGLTTVPAHSSNYSATYRRNHPQVSGNSSNASSGPTVVEHGGDIVDTDNAEEVRAALKRLGKTMKQLKTRLEQLEANRLAASASTP